MSVPLRYTRGTRFPRQHGVRNCLNNYFFRYTLLTPPYTRGTRIPHLLGVSNYLNNYFLIYTRMRGTVYVWNLHPPPIWVSELLK